MATLLLTALGTAIGGPLGGAIGGLLGQQTDQAIFGSGSGKGPRLKELTVTSSSYGQPIARHFGRMRVAGSIIWATDLVESETSQGGKIQGSTTSFTYSVSFAVALSSRPICRIGRIWADGNLLRGALGDLKVGGELRVYAGHGNDPVDPIIAADHGEFAPAFRDCAYVVFENLQLAEFGNRIPALSFEVFTQEEGHVSLDQIVPQNRASNDVVLEHAHGFSDEGGALSGSLAAISQLYPITCITSADGLRISSTTDETAPAMLPEQLSQQHSDEAEEREKRRSQKLGHEPIALRYYDEQRDYQPGVQRAIGTRPAGREVMLDLPAAMSADGAKLLANARAHRARWSGETMDWRIGELDPSLKLGGLVRVPEVNGIWRLVHWEWYDRGIVLGLEKTSPSGRPGFGSASDSGSSNPPVDEQSGPTILSFFEIPDDGSEGSATPLLYAAATSQSSGWKGASLYAVHGDSLDQIASAGSKRANVGFLVAALGPSTSTIFEPGATLNVQIAADDLELREADLLRISNGANRLLVGGEVLQFSLAEPLGNGRWTLTGLLRGRAGTEDFAAAGHLEGTPVILLDERITRLDSGNVVSDPSTRIAAIGRSDDTAVFADLSNFGLSRRPASPVHGALIVKADQSWELRWTRRSRGQWRWDDALTLPLVEEFESYRIGAGSVEAPFAIWTSDAPRLELSYAERANLVSQFGPVPLWVQQVGNHGRSPALMLATLN